MSSVENQLEHVKFRLCMEESDIIKEKKETKKNGKILIISMGTKSYRLFETLRTSIY